MQIIRADSCDWGRALEAGARSLAVVAVAAYTAGWVFGAWVHSSNAALAALASHGHRPTAPAAPIAAAIEAAPAAPITAAIETAPAAPIARDWAGRPFGALTVRELRLQARAAGHRALARSGRRAELLAVLAG